MIPKDLEEKLVNSSKHYLVTGGAGFIGSNLVETLLRYGQSVTTLDNFATGSRRNLNQVKKLVGKKNWERHTLIEGDITNLETCQFASQNVDIILHQAALGSVPRSLKDPLATHEANITGFLNMLIAAKENSIERFIYAASSSTYGDSTSLPKVESVIGNPLSPYAVTKYVNELYAKVFSTQFHLNVIGLRYFNVFGPRQDPNGAYAAVIPKWIGLMLNGIRCNINGDGSTTRDFCFIGNTVEANLRSALITNQESFNKVYNIACGERTSLNELHKILAENLSKLRPNLFIDSPSYSEFRKGDVMHSLADISLAKKFLKYTKPYSVEKGLQITSKWFAEHLNDD